MTGKKNQTNKKSFPLARHTKTGPDLLKGAIPGKSLFDTSATNTDGHRTRGTVKQEVV